ncbi:MAG: hypothetical protein Q8O43_06870 [Dehalococcoidia bacterium]|nr:hypothetical protein [Dehalococcoidia bacterium]
MLPTQGEWFYIDSVNQECHVHDVVVTGNSIGHIQQFFYPDVKPGFFLNFTRPCTVLASRHVPACPREATNAVWW